MSGCPTVGIVGGGFSGAAVAWHLARVSAPANVVIFEPNATLGAGLAYGPGDPAWRINVPAGKMTLLPDDPGHFERWVANGNHLAIDPEAYGEDGQPYPRRSLFGEYVDEHLRPFLRRGQVRHVRQAVKSARHESGRWRVVTEDGQSFEIDRLVIASTHPKPGFPAELSALRGHPRVVDDALRHEAIARIDRDARVLVVGSGLTAADVVAALKARGHSGRITLISRRGLLPRGQSPTPVEPFGDFSTNPSVTALGLLVRIRRAIGAAAAEGIGWHAVLDAVRTQGDGVWNGLALAERRRLLRHLRAFWDVHRFRIAPQVDVVLRAALTSGEAVHLRASLKGARLDGNELVVDLLNRRTGALLSLAVDVIVIATGPAHGKVIDSQPYLTDLRDAGWLRADPTALGLATSRTGRAIAADGRPVDTLFVAGPLARGTFGELMGLPQVSDYALFIADQLRDGLPVFTDADVHTPA